jgi:hypothetical protein
MKIHLLVVLASFVHTLGLYSGLTLNNVKILNDLGNVNEFREIRFPSERVSACTVDTPFHTTINRREVVRYLRSDGSFSEQSASADCRQSVNICVGVDDKLLHISRLGHKYKVRLIQTLNDDDRRYMNPGYSIHSLNALTTTALQFVDISNRSSSTASFFTSTISNRATEQQNTSTGIAQRAQSNQEIKDLLQSISIAFGYLVGAAAAIWKFLQYIGRLNLTNQEQHQNINPFHNDNVSAFSTLLNNNNSTSTVSSASSINKSSSNFALNERSTLTTIVEEIPENSRSSQQTFSRACDLIEEIRENSNDRKKCNTCNVEFKNANGLKGHLRSSSTCPASTKYARPQ